MMSWTDKLLQILKGLEAEGRKLRNSSGGYEPPRRYEGHAKDIATQMARILAGAQ